MARDYYEVLGIARTATADEIRRAHRKLAKEFHPDKNKSPEAPKRFSELQEAYDALSDPEKRKQYDQFGHVGSSANPFGGRGGRSQTGGGQTGGPWQNVKPEDLEEMMGGLGGIGDFFRGGTTQRGRSGRSAAQAGQNMEIEVTVDFMTAAGEALAMFLFEIPKGKIPRSMFGFLRGSPAADQCELQARAMMELAAVRLGI
jgi:molecular chaperone DnaJ